MTPNPHEKHLAAFHPSTGFPGQQRLDGTAPRLLYKSTVGEQAVLFCQNGTVEIIAGASNSTDIEAEARLGQFAWLLHAVNILNIKLRI